MSYILFVIGTRPELIKVAPLIAEIKNSNFNLPYKVINTAQHKDLLAPYWDIFDVSTDFTLDLMVPHQSLSALTSRAFSQFQDFIDKQGSKPAVIVAQGDTTSVMVASIVSFYNNIKFAHLEAGLRTYDYNNPFPEELNRRIAGLIADFHFAPTINSVNNLLREGVKPDSIYEVGNTVVDAIKLIVNSSNFELASFHNPKLDTLHENNYVIITCHRRENHGKNLDTIIEAITQLSVSLPNLKFVWLLHPNPNVADKVKNSLLANMDNIILTSPLDYLQLLKLISRCKLIITDSGGIQEEAPSFKKPVLVMREKTERPESVEEGYSFLVGADKDKIINTFNFLINNDIHFNGNPYGDGNASSRVLNILKNKLYEDISTI